MYHIQVNTSHAWCTAYFFHQLSQLLHFLLISILTCIIDTFTEAVPLPPEGFNILEIPTLDNIVELPLESVPLVLAWFIDDVGEGLEVLFHSKICNFDKLNF